MSASGPGNTPPWLRIERLIRSILEVRRDAGTQPVMKATLVEALKERDRIRRAGWMTDTGETTTRARHWYVTSVHSSASASSSRRPMASWSRVPSPASKGKTYALGSTTSGTGSGDYVAGL